MTEKRLARGVLVGYYILTLAAVVYRLWREMNVYNGLLALAALLLPAVPFLLYRACRWRRVYLLEVVFDGFVFAAVSFASLFGAYDFVPYWDKILHFLSGFLFAALGMVIFFSNKPDKTPARGDAVNAALFSFMFAILSAVLWEFWEFFVSRFGPDPQQVALTGVTDTMGDLFVCTLGGLFTGIACLRRVRHWGETRPRGLMMRLFEAFWRENIAKR